MSKVIGVDIGGTKILSAIVDENGNTIKTVRVPSEEKKEETEFSTISIKL